MAECFLHIRWNLKFKGILNVRIQGYVVIHLQQSVQYLMIIALLSPNLENKSENWMTKQSI